MESAISGFVGVLIGSFLTIAKDWWFQRRKDRKDAEYLSIQISCELERYIAGCAEVVADDGLCYGQADEDGWSKAQTSLPKFEPKLLDVDWKSLPANLMYEILDFPYRAEGANHRIDAFESNATPPDLPEWFEERQFQYATLGIAASRLASKLRHHVGLPERVVGDWNPVRHMEERKAAIELEREKLARRHSVPPSPPPASGRQAD